MPPALIAAIPAITSVVGAVAGANSKSQPGQQAHNLFTPDNPSEVGYSQQSVQSNLGRALNNAPTYQGATQDVMNNPMLSQLFGKGGLMGQTGNSIQDLMNTGYNLTPEDHTAYGQASGNIARQFGQSEHGLSQSLSNRGMSNSGAAGAAFSGMQGNKQEQLAGLQTQIADQRMKTNMDRLTQMQNFMTSLGSQAQGAQGQAFNQKLQGNQQSYDMNHGMLASMQGQNNEGMKQAQQGASPNQLGTTLSGGLQGMSGGIGLASQVGGMFGTGSTPTSPTADTGAITGYNYNQSPSNFFGLGGKP